MYQNQLEDCCLDNYIIVGAKYSNFDSNTRNGIKVIEIVDIVQLSTIAL